MSGDDAISRAEVDPVTGAAGGSRGGATAGGRVEDPLSVRSAVARWAWFAVGWVAVGLGSLGVVVPGLPTTVFFIVAASCFARSSPRFERWVLALPRVGPLVRDHRAGLGMPRRAKVWAIGMIVAFAGTSAVLSRGRPAVAAAIVVVGAAGVAYIVARVPTRERVLAERGLPAEPGISPRPDPSS